ncbi:MAG: DUF424 family protein [Nitrososphaerota archaeon]|nr:DUF424 family protein [Candidatus Geocrenenecus dongiae]
MGGRFWVKIHHSKTGEVVVAVCDEELLEKSIEIRKGFSIEISRAFYGGYIVGEEELDKSFKEATIINLLGDRIVGYALKRGMIDEGAVIKVGGIPHVQIYR